MESEKAKEKEDELYLPDSMTSEFQKTLDALTEAQKWEELAAYLKPLADKYTEEYFIMSELSAVYYMLGKKEETLIYAQRAYRIERHDVIVLYAWASALHMNDRNQEALDICNRIIKKKVHDIAFGPHGEGLSWAMTFKIDTIFLKAACIIELGGDMTEALRLLKLYLKKRTRGIISNFSRGQAIEMIKTIRDNLKSTTK